MFNRMIFLVHTVLLTVVVNNLFLMKAEALSDQIADRLIISQATGQTSIFLEEGRRQMQREIQRLNKQRPQPVLTVKVGMLDWQNLMLQDGRFSVWMPQATVAESREILNVVDYPITLQIFATDVADTQFFVAYSLPVSSGATRNMGDFWQRVQGELVNTTGFELMNSRGVRLQRHEGREISLRKGASMMQVQMFLVERRLYLLGVNQVQVGDIPSQAIQGFFNSVQIR
jgi:hypothetical protein